jgi:hypothetical protein
VVAEFDFLSELCGLPSRPLRLKSLDLEARAKAFNRRARRDTAEFAERIKSIHSAGNTRFHFFLRRRNNRSLGSASPSSPPLLKIVPGEIAPVRSRRRSHRWRWISLIFLLLLIVAAIGVRIVIVRAEPILRSRVIETLSARFKSRVELAELHVWVARG